MVMSRERSSRPRARPASDDGQQLVDNTLKEIRKRQSSTYRLSSDEINQLLGDIRRSRSASEGRAGSRPPPPRGSPPPLPENSLPFGRSSKQNKKGGGEETVSEFNTLPTSIYGKRDTCHKSEPPPVPPRHQYNQLNAQNSKQDSLDDDNCKIRPNDVHIKQSKKSYERKLAHDAATDVKHSHTKLNKGKTKDTSIQASKKGNKKKDGAIESETAGLSSKSDESRTRNEDCMTQDGLKTGINKEGETVAKDNNEGSSSDLDPALDMVFDLRQRLEAMTNELERVQAAADRISCLIDDASQETSETIHKQDNATNEADKDHNEEISLEQKRLNEDTGLSEDEEWEASSIECNNETHNDSNDSYLNVSEAKHHGDDHLADNERCIKSDENTNYSLNY